MADPFISQIIIMGCNFAPRNWSMCQGQLLAISQNQALFALIGDMYGGDARTTMGLPDCRGRAFVGYNPNFTPYLRTVIGQTGGTEQVQLGIAQMPSHDHAAVFTETGFAAQVEAYDGPANQNSPDGNYLASGRDSSDARVRNYTDSTPNVLLAGVSGSVAGDVTVGTTGSGAPFTVKPPFQAMNYVISLQGTFPPRN